jgi:uncharacterized membrane protein YcaP (DUF421 family)
MMHFALVYATTTQEAFRWLPTPNDWYKMIVPALSVLEKMLRPFFVYIFLVVALRIFGKRELAQLNPFDLVVLLSLSNTVQNSIIGEDNSLTGGLIGALTLLLINYGVVRFLFKHRRLDQIVEGDPSLLIKNGRLRRKELAKELITEPELLMAARRQDFESLDEIETAELHPGGIFHFKGKKPPLDERMHTETIKRLDELSRQIAALKQEKVRE